MGWGGGSVHGGGRGRGSVREIPRAVGVEPRASPPLHPRPPPPTHPPTCSMRQPTVSALHGASGATVGYALQIAARANEIPNLIPVIKAEGGTDLIVTGIRMLVA